MTKKTYEKSKKIIYVSVSPVQTFAFREAGLEYLMEHGYEVIVWTVEGYEKKPREKSFDKAVDVCEVRHIQFFSEYEKLVKEYKKDSIFILDTLNDAAVLYPICNNECTYFVLGFRSVIPVSKDIDHDTSRVDGETLKERIHDWYMRYRGRFLLYPYIKVKKGQIEKENREYRQAHTDLIVEKQRPKALFVTNKFALDDMVYQHLVSDADKLNVIYTNSRTYNDYLLEEEKGEEISEDFILCANSGAGFYGAGVYKCHTEEAIYQPEQNKKYLDQIIKMLDKLEEHYHMPVIVANHPRCDLRGYDFGGRKIINGRTCELTKKCKMFVTATTGAIAYAVFYNKDILFFYNDCIKDETLWWPTTYYPLMEALQLKGLDLDNEEMIEHPWNYVEKIDPEVKQRYLETYQYEKGAINKIFGEVLFDEVEKCL